MQSTRAMPPFRSQLGSRRVAEREEHSPSPHHPHTDGLTDTPGAPPQGSTGRDTFTSDPIVRRSLKDQSMSSWEMVAWRSWLQTALLVSLCWCPRASGQPALGLSQAVPGGTGWHLGCHTKPSGCRAALNLLQPPDLLHGGLQRTSPAARPAKEGLMLTVTGSSRPCHGPLT